ncbi:hypothetical protein [Edwardsiella piscicida]|nr:hypothetical protein [Edwardsiella piscicida]WGS79017.1 hypothetical protein PED70_09635 [Edwardsiella piscicida]
MNHLLKRPLSNRDAFLFIIALLLLNVPRSSWPTSITGTTPSAF